MPSLKGFRIKVKPANTLEQLLNKGGNREKAAQLQLWQEEYLLKLRGNLVKVLSLAFNWATLRSSLEVFHQVSLVYPRFQSKLQLISAWWKVFWQFKNMPACFHHLFIRKLLGMWSFTNGPPCVRVRKKRLRISIFGRLKHQSHCWIPNLCPLTLFHFNTCSSKPPSGEE